MSYKAVFFDWDGTLVQTSELIIEAHNHVRQHFGLELIESTESLTRGNQSTRELYPQIYGDKAKEAEQVLYRFFEQNHLESLKAYEDSEIALTRLKERNIPLGLVSNKRHSFLVKELKYLGWESFFGPVVGAGEASRDKPHPDPLLMAVDGNSLKDILYIGDTETDLKCAQAAGCDAALILRGRTLDHLITAYSPTHVMENLENIEIILEKTDPEENKKKAC